MAGKNIGLAGLSNLVKKLFSGNGNVSMPGGGPVKAVKGQSRGRKPGKFKSKKRPIASGRDRRRP